MDLQGIARAILITQAAFVAIYHEARSAFGFPGVGGNIAFVVGFVHTSSLPCPAAPVRCLSRLTLPGTAGPCRALSCNWSPVSSGVSLPGLALPRRTTPHHVAPRPAAPRLTAPGLALKKKSACLPASWSLLLKDAPAKWQIDRPMPATKHKNSGYNVLQRIQCITV